MTTLLVQDDYTVLDVKKMLDESNNYKVDETRLYFEKKLLQDNMKLKDAGVVGSSIIKACCRGVSFPKDLYYTESKNPPSSFEIIPDKSSDFISSVYFDTTTRDKVHSLWEIFGGRYSMLQCQCLLVITANNIENALELADGGFFEDEEFCFVKDMKKLLLSGNIQQVLTIKARVMTKLAQFRKKAVI